MNILSSTDIGGGANSALTINTSIGSYQWSDYTLSTPSSFLISLSAGYFDVANAAGNIRLDPSGFVGIGGAVPYSKLDVFGTAYTATLGQNDYSIASFRGAGTTQLSINSKNGAPYSMTMQSKLNTGASTAYPLGINPLGGNVGVGTDDPTARLNVGGNIDGLTIDGIAVKIDSIIQTSSTNGLNHTGLLAIPIFNTSNSNVQNAYGVKITPTQTGTFTITNAYGLMVDAPTVTSGIMTNSYAASFNGKVGVGTVAPLAGLHSELTTEQLRLSYDASNYAKFTVNSTGILTIEPAGTNAYVSILNRILVPSSGIATNASTGGSNLYVVGGQNSTNNSTVSQIQIGGGNTAQRMAMRGAVSTTQTAGYSYASFVIGANMVTEAGSGTHPIWANLAVKALDVTTGAATVTNSATVYIEAASSNATNNYALWVDDGTTRLDGALELQGVANATAANVLFYDSTTKAVTYGTAPAGGSGSGIVRSVNSISAPTTAGSSLTTDYVYFVSGTTTLTLPTAISNTNRYTVKNTGSNTVTIATTSSQTIDGSTTITLIVNQAVDVISNNSNWFIV